MPTTMDLEISILDPVLVTGRKRLVATVVTTELQRQ